MNKTAGKYSGNNCSQMLEGIGLKYLYFIKESSTLLTKGVQTFFEAGPVLIILKKPPGRRRLQTNVFDARQILLFDW